MSDLDTYTWDLLQYTYRRIPEIGNQLWHAGIDQLKAQQLYTNGALKYFGDFITPFWIAYHSFNAIEKKKLLQTPPLDTLNDYLDLLLFNLQIYEKGLSSNLSAMQSFHLRQINRCMAAWLNTVLDLDKVDIAQFSAKQLNLFEAVVRRYPEAIVEIKSEYGFHFDQDGYRLAAETDRFWLYQVLPQPSGAEVRQNGKPVVILPPYVLGPNILAFLPGEHKSYVHCFANQGIPTYIRVLKDIDHCPAVQTMTSEDDARDTRYFCEQVRQRHGHPVTLNGFCQGGFVAVLNILSGQLDGLVDALITCVAPMDGTRSKSLVEYLKHLPPRFRDLGYAVKTLANGNRVVDGKVMSWVYKLKSMEREAPLFAFYRDLMLFDHPAKRNIAISKTAAAINHWLIFDRQDIPEAITKMSFDSYTVPVTRDGTLPVSLFGRRLNFQGLKQRDLRILICYAKQDDLVDKPAALAPLDFIEAEVTVFPKGHGAIATSWSHPMSECALDTVFGDNYRGPVRFQLDLEEELLEEK